MEGACREEAGLDQGLDGGGCLRHRRSPSGSPEESGETPEHARSSTADGV